jgi:hypothetical protein
MNSGEINGVVEFDFVTDKIANSGTIESITGSLRNDAINNSGVLSAP